MTSPAQEGERIVEVFAVDHSKTLCGQSLTEIVVLIIEMVICFQSQVAVATEKVFYVEITDKRGVGRALVAVSEIAVDKKTIVEKA